MDVKFKMGNDVTVNTPSQEAGSIIIDKKGKKLYIDISNTERIQIGGGVSDPDGKLIEQVELIPLSITEDGNTNEYYLLAIPKNENN